MGRELPRNVPGLPDETPRPGHNGMDVGPDQAVLDEATEALLWFG